MVFAYLNVNVVTLLSALSLLASAGSPLAISSFFSRFPFSFRELSLAFGERAQTVRHFGDEFAHGQPLQPGFRDCLCTIESARQLAKHGGGGVRVVTEG
jgi:hypothetical protein